jgi:predicted ATPase
VFWVGLAAFREPTLLSQHVGHVLGGHGELVDHIAHNRLLLLLDNFEHLVTAAPDVSTLLRECPRFDVLVTSRERLQLEGEHEWTVPPLARRLTAHVEFRGGHPVDARAQRMVVQSTDCSSSEMALGPTR